MPDMRMGRFTLALVLAMHAWSSELLAGQIACDPGVCFDTMVHVVDRTTAATKGDIDALNKRLDQLEDLIRCLGPEVHAADDGVTPPQKDCP
jgi:hypothetical protein